MPASRAAAAPPNIVLILADDLGFSDTAPYGSEIPTPHISRLAAEGIRFSNYHTAASCAPTRGMLLTGVDSHRNGVPNIPESIPPYQAEQPHYRGTLNHDVVTIATLLADAGYHTYMTGKWHLGMDPDLLPSKRGFERTVALADTGADNWEMKPYLPIYEKANWFADGRELDELPADFYSSKFFIDKTIEFIESNRADDRPFFSYIPFQAVHIPVQAPQEHTDKYMGVYDPGWTRLREQRLERAKLLGIVPPATRLARVTTTQDWDALADEEKRYASKRMAVYAGMIDAMDHQIGRLIDYLEKIGEYENTVFLFVSDNGAEGSDPTYGTGGGLFRLWLWSNDYSTDYETLGTRGSFMNIGPSFASAAAAPLAYYKFFASEGGMRVPLIIAGSAVASKGGISNAFSYVTDIAPAILEIAGVTPPSGEYAGRPVEVIIGKSLYALVTGSTDSVHPADEPIGYELGGNAALFKGDYKIVKDRGPIGDDEWHLFDIVSDPGESRDLRDAEPERFSAMLDDYRSYAENNRVLPVRDGYDQRTQVGINALQDRIGRGFILGAAVFVVLLAAWVWRRVHYRLRKRGAPASA
ncbi:MAG: arylsulfatase [Myxococcota bacterium]